MFSKTLQNLLTKCFFCDIIKISPAKGFKIKPTIFKIYLWFWFLCFEKLDMRYIPILRLACFCMYIYISCKYRVILIQIIFSVLLSLADFRCVLCLILYQCQASNTKRNGKTNPLLKQKQKSLA